MTIQEQLFELQDQKYRDFQSRLVPGIPKEAMIGVRMPDLRKLAREIDGEAFLQDLPHQYHDENILHGILISNLKSYEAVLQALDRFLPYVDNWAACDVISPQVFKKHRPDLLESIKQWLASDHVYTCRFAIKMLMTHYLTGAFEPAYLDWPLRVESEDYYLQMMQAWFYATALASQWEATLPYLEERQLSPWVHRQTIQKGCDSRRLTAEQKDYLRSLRD